MPHQDAGSPKQTTNMNKKYKTLPSQVWNFSGPNKIGPKVLVLGGTHGDELVGVTVVRELLKKFGSLNKPCGEYKNTNVIGTLYVGFGNPEAILRGTRATGEIKDLNRSFVPAELKQNSPRETPDTARAQDLTLLLKQIDFLFDVHATSSPSKPFVCSSKVKKRHFEYFPIFPVDTILVDPNNVLAKDLNQKVTGTTDFYVNNYGKRGALGFCYESGWEKDENNAKRVFGIVVRLLVKAGVLKKNFAREIVSGGRRRKRKQQLYVLKHCIVAKENSFRYVKGMNRGWKKVKEGQIVGRYKSGRAERIEHGGCYVFPKAETKIEKGKSLYYIARGYNKTHPR